MTAHDVKVKLAGSVDRLADRLEALSHRIHANPELAYQEENAHAWLTEFLQAHGARVERGVGGLPTAFRATIPGQSSGPTIAILCEYDALPGLGHAGQTGYGSTDCGNLSQVLPAIHPYVRIAPDGVPGHSREFAEWARSPLARAGLVAGAKALAMTALDLLVSPETLQQAKDDFTRGGGM